MRFTRIILLLLSIISTQSISWEIDEDSKYIRYYTNGNVVHGHKFGFIKTKANCNKDYLFIQWSSYEDMKQFEGEMIPMLLTNDKGNSGRIKPPLESVHKLGISEVGFFDGLASGLIATDGLIKFLENSNKLTIVIDGDEYITKGFDIAEDSFNTSGFIDERAKAKDFCLVN